MMEKELYGAETPLSVSIAEAVTDNANVENADFTLYDSIDPDALNSLFSAERAEDGDLRVVFGVLDQTVVVERVDGMTTIHVNG